MLLFFGLVKHLCKFHLEIDQYTKLFLNEQSRKQSQSIHVRIDQHVPKILKSWFDGRSDKPTKSNYLRLDNICWKIMSKR